MEFDATWHTFKETAQNGLAVAMDDARLQQYQTLYQLVITGNKVHNLTRITSLQDFCQQHLLDSLSLSHFLNSAPPSFSIVDIGSGAGFPALPLAIAYPQAAITAVESTQKKAHFIQETAQALGLTNIQVVSQRSEIAAHQPAYRQQFDFATARAVSHLNVLIEICLPFIKLGGYFLAMKTRAAVETEMSLSSKAIQILGGKPSKTYHVELPALSARSIVCIQKVRPSPGLYPRKPGTPQKNAII